MQKLSLFAAFTTCVESMFGRAGLGHDRCDLSTPRFWSVWVCLLLSLLGVGSKGKTKGRHPFCLSFPMRQAHLQSRPQDSVVSFPATKSEKNTLFKKHVCAAPMCGKLACQGSKVQSNMGGCLTSTQANRLSRKSGAQHVGISLFSVIARMSPKLVRGGGVIII